MLKGNLATRPFYNERLVTLFVALVGVVGLALAAYNVTRIVDLSGQRSALRSRIAHDNSEAARIDAETQAIQKSINIEQLNGLAASTGEANALIDQRTFSWTAFFTIISKTLPLDARLIAVAPKQDSGNLSGADAGRGPIDGRPRDAGESADGDRRVLRRAADADAVERRWHDHGDDLGGLPATETRRRGEGRAAMNLWRRIYLERRQVILPVVGFLVANIAVLILALLPLAKSVSDNQTEANESRAKLAMSQMANKNAKDARSRRDQAQQELGKFYSKVLPRNHDVAVSLLNFQVRQAAVTPASRSSRPRPCRATSRRAS